MFWPMYENPLKVWFWNNAPRASKFADYCRRSRPDPVRGSTAHRAVLSTYWTASCLGAAHSICPAQQLLQHQRLLVSSPLSSGAGFGTDRIGPTGAPKRRVSLLGRFAGLPRRNCLRRFPDRFRAAGKKLPGQVA